MNLQFFGQSYAPTSNHAINRPNGFVMQRGNIPEQAKNYIAKYDANRDGVLSFEEYQKVGSLTGEMKSTVSSPELAKAMFAMVAGPSMTMNAAEWARGTVYMDENIDGTITQAELDKATQVNQNRVKVDKELAITDMY
jgi:hypothetical protein